MYPYAPSASAWSASFSSSTPVTMIAAVSGYVRADVGDDVEPGLAGHLQIADQQLEGLDGEQLLRRDAVLGRRARVAGPLEEPADQFAHVPVVVDDQDARRCRRSRCHPDKGSVPRLGSTSPEWGWRLPRSREAPRWTRFSIL